MRRRVRKARRTSHDVSAKLAVWGPKHLNWSFRNAKTAFVCRFELSGGARARILEVSIYTRNRSNREPYLL